MVYADRSSSSSSGNVLYRAVRHLVVSKPHIMLFSAALVRPTKSLPYCPFFFRVPLLLVYSNIFISPPSPLPFSLNSHFPVGPTILRFKNKYVHPIHFVHSPLATTVTAPLVAVVFGCYCYGVYFYKLDDLQTDKTKQFQLLQSAQSYSGAHTTLFRMGNGKFFFGVRRLGREGDRSLSSSVVV